MKPEEINFIYDKPYDYEGILIHPVKMKYYLEFHSCINCLLLEKNKIPDIRIVKMDYLDYLFYLSEKNDENKMLIEMLGYLFSLVLDEQDCKLYKDSNNKITLVINNKTFNGNDFDNIKRIILNQNGIEHEELLLDEEIEKALQDASEYKSKGEKFADLEEQMIVYHLYTGLDYEKIYNLPIRKFNKAIQRMCVIENFKLYKTAELGGMVKFKEDIQYWLSHIEPKNKLDGLVVKDADKSINSLKSALK